jgi:dipeptidase E
MRLLLGSGGFSTPERQDGWKRALDDFLGSVQHLLFIPYAVAHHDRVIEQMIRLGFHAGRGLTGIHRAKDPVRAIEEAEAIYVGGGNSFRLLKALYDGDLLPSIRQRVTQDGIPYIGVSAGTNMACPTMKTTNDMPILAPPRLDALGLIPFQINPHYFSGPIFLESSGGMVKYGGETRDDRLHEFHEENELPVLGLWEGAILRVEESELTLSGTGGARLFRRGEKEIDFAPGAQLPLILRHCDEEASSTS